MDFTVAIANLQSGIGITKGYREYLTSGWRYLFPHKGRAIDAAGTWLRDTGVDLALCLELSAPRRREQAAQLERLQAESGLPYSVFFPTPRPGKSVHEGSAILSRYPLTATSFTRLRAGTLPRVIGSATLEYKETTITIFVVHLALQRKERAEQLRELVALIKSTDGPIIVGGDFNERDWASFSVLEEVGLTPAFTHPSYPSWNPKHALQALFLSEHFTATRLDTGSTRFSDHLPLLAEVSLRATSIRS